MKMMKKDVNDNNFDNISENIATAKVNTATSITATTKIRIKVVTMI